MYGISPNLCLKLSYCAAENASLMGAEGEWARKKADAVAGWLGHSKMEGESNCRPSSFLFTCCKQQSGVGIQEKNFFCCTSVCWFSFFTGSLKLGTTQRDDCASHLVEKDFLVPDSGWRVPPQR